MKAGFGKKSLRVLFAFLLIFAALLVPIIAEDLPVVSNWAAITNLVNGAWATNTSLAKIIPPMADMAFVIDQGIFSAGTNVDLTGLVGVESLGITTFPVRIIESNTTPRVRNYFNATGGIFRTEGTPAGWSPSNWAATVYGTPGSWLTGTNLDAWYADRDPIRERIAMNLIPETSVSNYLTALTNTATSGSGGTNFFTLFSNDTLFVQTIPNMGGGANLYVHAPASVTGFSIYVSGDLLIPRPAGWTLAARLAHTTDPLAYGYASLAAAANFMLGTSDDTDGDGISDSDEVMLFGTSPLLADSDGDGLSDREEIMQYDSIATKWSSADDGLSDYWKAKLANTNPKTAMDANAVDDDGLTALDRQRLGIGTNHYVVVDLGPDDVFRENKNVQARLTKLKCFADFGTGTNFYRTSSVTFDDTESEIGEWGEVTTHHAWGTDTWTAATCEATQQIRYVVVDHTDDGWDGCGDSTTLAIRVNSAVNEALYASWCDYYCSTHELISQGSSTDQNWMLNERLNSAMEDVHTNSSVSRVGRTHLSGAGYGTNFIATETLNELYSTTDMVAEAVQRISTVALSSLSWVSTTNTGCPDVPYDGYIDNLAIRYVSTGETNAIVGKLQYRMGILDAVSGVVYRATVAHVFTPQGSTNSVVLAVTNLLACGLGTGDDIYLLPTNGITIDPPTNNGSISVAPYRIEILPVLANPTSSVPWIVSGEPVLDSALDLNTEGISSYAPDNGSERGQPATTNYGTSDIWFTLDLSTNSQTATLSLTSTNIELASSWTLTNCLSTSVVYRFEFHATNVDVSAVITNGISTNSYFANASIHDAAYVGTTDMFEFADTVVRIDTNPATFTNFKMYASRATNGYPKWSDRNIFVLNLVGLPVSALGDVSLQLVTDTHTNDYSLQTSTSMPTRTELIVPVVEMDESADLGLEGNVHAIVMSSDYTPVKTISKQVSIQTATASSGLKINQGRVLVNRAMLISPVATIEEKIDGLLSRVNSADNAAGIARDSLGYETTLAVTPEYTWLQTNLLRYSSWIYSGHGNYKAGILCVRKKNGNLVPDFFTSAALAGHPSKMRFVFMNCCESTDVSYYLSPLNGQWQSPVIMANHTVMDIGISSLHADNYVGWDCDVYRPSACKILPAFMNALDESRNVHLAIQWLEANKETLFHDDANTRNYLPRLRDVKYDGRAIDLKK